MMEPTPEMSEVDNSEAPFYGEYVSPTRKSTASSDTGLFGLRKNRSPAAYNPFDYEQKYPEDLYGQETGPNARMWRTYLDETEIYDVERTTAWKDNIDVLLVFAGLFSAIVAGFVIQTSQDLRPDYTERTSSLLMELISIQRAVVEGRNATEVPSMSEPFSPSFHDKLVNVLWFTSLSLSLTNALLAVLTKQWLHQYMANTSGTLRDRSRIRQYRHAGLEKWLVPMIIELLPVLLHAAVALFLVGLIFFLIPLYNVIAWISGVITGSTYLFYIISTLIPIFDPQCPYKTPLTIYIYKFFQPAYYRQIWNDAQDMVSDFEIPTPENMRSSISSFTQAIRQNIADWAMVSQPATMRVAERVAMNRYGEKNDADAIQFLVLQSSNPTVKSIAFQAIGGLSLSQKPLDDLKGLSVGTSISVELYTELRTSLDISGVADSKVERLLRAAMHYGGATGKLNKYTVTSAEFGHLRRLWPFFMSSLVNFDNPPSGHDYAHTVLDYLVGPNRKTHMHHSVWAMLLLNHKTFTFGSPDSNKALILALFQSLDGCSELTKKKEDIILPATLLSCIQDDVSRSGLKDGDAGRPGVHAFRLIFRLVGCGDILNVDLRPPIEDQLSVLHAVWQLMMQWYSTNKLPPGFPMGDLVAKYLKHIGDVVEWSRTSPSTPLLSATMDMSLSIIESDMFVKDEPFTMANRIRILNAFVGSRRSRFLALRVRLIAIKCTRKSLRNLLIVARNGQEFLDLAPSFSGDAPEDPTSFITITFRLISVYLTNNPAAVTPFVLDGGLDALLWVPPLSPQGLSPAPMWQTEALKAFFEILTSPSPSPDFIEGGQAVDAVYQDEILFRAARALALFDLVPQLMALARLRPDHSGWPKCAQRLVAMVVGEQENCWLGPKVAIHQLRRSITTLKHALGLYGSEYDLPPADFTTDSEQP